VDRLVSDGRFLLLPICASFVTRGNDAAVVNSFRTERFLGWAVILTAESRTVSSRDGKQSHARVRLVAVYAPAGGAIRLVDFQSTMLPETETP